MYFSLLYNFNLSLLGIQENSKYIILKHDEIKKKKNKFSKLSHIYTHTYIIQVLFQNLFFFFNCLVFVLRHFIASLLSKMYAWHVPFKRCIACTYDKQHNAIFAFLTQRSFCIYFVHRSYFIVVSFLQPISKFLLNSTQ